MKAIEIDISKLASVMKEKKYVVDKILTTFLSMLIYLSDGSNITIGKFQIIKRGNNMFHINFDMNKLINDDEVMRYLAEYGTVMVGKHK